MSNEITLFDIPTKGVHPVCWSLNPWKARASLNYKQIPYKTEWIEYPDIAPRFQELGVTPNDKETNPRSTYSCPAVRLPDGTIVMDSRKVAAALDRLQPEPSLHTADAAAVDQAQGVVNRVVGAVAPLAMPRVPALLAEPSAAYFLRTRGEWFGMSLPELAVSDRAEGAWTKAQPALEELRQLLVKEQGPFILGSAVSFSDFVVAG